MAVWAMGLMALTGGGLWAPLDLIAHVVWRSAPLDGTFSARALLTGMLVHVTVAMGFGAVIALLAQRMPARRSLVVVGGLVLAAVVWALMQFVVWRAADRVAEQAFTPWVLATSHLVFGALSAAAASIFLADAESRTHRMGDGLCPER